MSPLNYSDAEFGGRKRRPIDDLLDPRFAEGAYMPRTRPRGRSVPFLPSTPATPIPETPDNREADESPWVNPFMKVYETTKAGAMENLEEMQELMGKKFAHRGGYFGGTHAVAQSELAEETGRFLDELLAKVSLGAEEKQYEDWKRGREEMFSLANLIPILLGIPTTQPIVQMPQQTGGGLLGNLLGMGLGAFTGGAGAGLGQKIGGK